MKKIIVIVNNTLSIKAEKMIQLIKESDVKWEPEMLMIDDVKIKSCIMPENDVVIEELKPLTKKLQLQRQQRVDKNFYYTVRIVNGKEQMVYIPITKHKKKIK